MTRFTQRQLKDMVYYGSALDVTHATQSDYHALKNEEGGFDRIGYSSGTYGCNGLLLRGWETGKLYAITKRTTAIYLFG